MSVFSRCFSQDPGLPQRHEETLGSGGLNSAELGRSQAQCHLQVTDTGSNGDKLDTSVRRVFHPSANTILSLCVAVGVTQEGVMAVQGHAGAAPAGLLLL